MAIKVVAAKAHQIQLDDPDIIKELKSVENEVNHSDIKYIDGSVNFVLIKAHYDHFEKKMLTVCLFVNKTHHPISALYGKLDLHFVNENADISTAAIGFDKAFLGILNDDSAVLIHLWIPVKGLSEDKEFTYADFKGGLTNIKVINDEEEL